MQLLKHVIFTVIITISTFNAKAQFYGKVEYWGKEIQLDRSFFDILNSNYNNFMSNTAKSWKYYDFRDYQDIYISVVEHLKRVTFTVSVSEANQLSWTNSYSPPMPGQSDETDRSKKSKARAGWILYHVLLPSIQTYAKDKL